MLTFGESFYLYYYCLDRRKFVKHSVGGCWEVRDPKLPRFFLFTKTTELLIYNTNSENKSRILSNELRKRDTRNAGFLAKA